ncbi:MAG TPA: hypothetical protein EYP86_00990 [Candidatus Altiarchaeales archaeon]|nr:hypothetical protein [Candidatus Altiarchaeales archaeon]
MDWIEMTTKTTKKNLGKKGTKKEEIKIRMLGKSILVEHDLQEAERRARLKEGIKKPRLFYRNFVYRCENCISEFEHETGVPIVEHEVICPVCEEIHIIKIIPASRHYELKLPKKLRVVRASKRKKK